MIFEGYTLEARAEVGLLTRNIVIRGSNNPQWHDKIEACPDGFDTGEFAVQTCFQGRFGEEIGNDQFGSQIIIHSPEIDSQLSAAHIEYVEVTYAGQAFRLGRYAIHFHLNGNMSGSYVRGCSIHKSFNRAINVHNSHNVLIEHNVIYDIMGGALFTEDGIETGNIYQYNLVMFVKSSTSLLNDDITPAAYWVTNPSNVYRHNVAAGGTHFGWWYRMHQHPDGPSFTRDIVPAKLLWVISTTIPFTPRVGLVSGFSDNGLPCRVDAAGVLLQNQPGLNVSLPGTVRRDLNGLKVAPFKFTTLFLLTTKRRA